MKKLLCIFLLCISITAKAQDFSNWINDQKIAGLQVRYKIGRDADNYSYIYLQIKSTKACKMNITASACNTDAKEKNGWKYITLIANKVQNYRFKILNSCTNGFWWWYNDYKSTAVRFDDL